MRVRLLSLLVLWVLATPVAGSELRWEGPPLPDDYRGPMLVDNSQYRYTAHDMLAFSTAEHLTDSFPELLPLRSAIDTWAARVGIHPRLLSAVVRDSFAGSTVFGDWVDQNTVAQLAAGLGEVYALRASDPLAASQAVAAVSRALGFELDLPADLADARQLVAAPTAGPPLFGYFQPPWEIGDTWSGGGAHGPSHNALDFWGDWVPWGGDTTPYWVSAMQEGVARVWSSCSMSVIHPNGWTTSYYHLDNILVADQTPVLRNDRLANYADNEPQAICDGGFSTGPHVHMYQRYDGTNISVDEANVDFTAFSHHAGVGDYDTNCDRSWYNHFTVGTVCPNWDLLLNDAPGPGPLFEDGFESGSTANWTSTILQ